MGCVIIRLSCVLAVLICLLSTGNAGSINWDRQRLQQLHNLSTQTTNPSTRLQIAYEVVEMYKKYRGQEHSDIAEETELNAGVDNFESKIELVEGVPKQGAGFRDFFRADWIPNKVKSDATNLAKSSSQALIDGIAKYLLNKLWSSIGLAK
ncbi:protein Turandot Z [Drosophila serrata]|uniref:protein Turandot Z n=1 Tax=Drosophila serrata TaxID=7274 RepID=UPI000A1D11E1|nr:protein Turandot Z [Drosophila serrata]